MGRPIYLLGLQPGSARTEPWPKSAIRPSASQEKKAAFGCRVVVVEQLEQVREPALLAAPRLAAKPGGAVGGPWSGDRSGGR